MRGKPSRILLVDDESTFRRSTATLLEQEGYRCDCAEDSESGSRMLTDEHDVLLSDIRMPGNMQFEFLRDVRARFPLLPIVLVTGYPSVPTAVDALRLSFLDYLLKPVDWLELLRSVNQAAEKSRYLRMTEVARVENDRVTASLDYVREAMIRPGAMAHEKNLAWSLDTFLSQSAGQMALLAAGVQSVMARQAGTSPEATTDVCRALECPIRSAYQEALVSTVKVLEKTKSAFQSKDLGLLRRKLEQLLKGHTGGGSGSR